jgi:hypothetical protein
MSKGVLAQLEFQPYSCLVLANFGYFLVQRLGSDPQRVNKTDGYGNRAHAYLKSISSTIRNGQIYLDPTVFTYQFQTLRGDFNFDKSYQKSYSNYLQEYFLPPGIAYEANRNNFRRVFSLNQAPKTNPCNGKLEVLSKNGKVTVESQGFTQVNDCIGELYALTWYNRKQKNIQAKLFTFLFRNGKGDLITIPSFKSRAYQHRDLLGNLEVKINDWLYYFLVNYPDSNLNQLRVKEIEYFEEFIPYDIGDFSDYLKKD